MSGKTDKKQGQPDRKARLADALRENLKRRKAQSRDRKQPRDADTARTGEQDRQK